MTVLNGDGLVGRVKTVGPTTATVLLAVDPESSVGVRLEGSMEVGFTTGQGVRDEGALDLRLLDGQSAVAPGRPDGDLRVAGRHPVRTRCARR